MIDALTAWVWGSAIGALTVYGWLMNRYEAGEPLEIEI